MPHIVSWTIVNVKYNYYHEFLIGMTFVKYVAHVMQQNENWIFNQKLLVKQYIAGGAMGVADAVMLVLVLL